MNNETEHNTSNFRLLLLSATIYNIFIHNAQLRMTQGEQRRAYVKIIVIVL